MYNYDDTMEVDNKKTAIITGSGRGIGVSLFALEPLMKLALRYKKSRK